MRKIKTTIVDLWADPGTRNYTAPLAIALAKHEDMELSLMLNRRTVLRLYGQALAKGHARLFRAPLGYFPLSDLLLQPFELARLVFHIFRDKPDILHFTFMHPWLTLLLPILRLRFPIAITWHDLHIHEGEVFLRHRLAQWVMKRYAHALFVHSEALRARAISEHGIAAERVFVVPHGTYDHWRALASGEVQEEPATFLFFGRILPYKAPDVMLQAFRILHGHCPEARLILAGAGDLAPYQSLMQGIEANLELHNRPIDEGEATGFFARATCIVLCHREISQSGVVFAAAALRKAVIASRVGDLAELITNGETGISIEPENPEDLASAMGWMLEHPAERRRMGTALHEKIIESHGAEKVYEASMMGYMHAMRSVAE